MLFNALVGLFIFTWLYMILIIPAFRSIKRRIADRRWEKECKKFLLTPEEIQKMKDRAQKAREDE